MPSTLLLRLSGPMQAWGIDSRFDLRETMREPTKSGVIGLLCAALGKPREERPDEPFPSLASLAALRMGVRVDREGHPARDYQTAGGTHRGGDAYGVRTANNKSSRTVQSHRDYLADASFLVGLEGPPKLLEQLAEALRRPVWQLYLGRKAFVPSVPVWLPASAVGPSGVVPVDLQIALRSVDWGDERAPECRAVLEVDAGQHSESRRDVPIDFRHRRFSERFVRATFLSRQGVDDVPVPTDVEPR
jgi:CRISPR system Cascade subunit CasD